MLITQCHDQYKSGAILLLYLYLTNADGINILKGLLSQGQELLMQRAVTCCLSMSHHQIPGALSLPAAVARQQHTSESEPEIPQDTFFAEL